MKTTLLLLISILCFATPMAGCALDVDDDDQALRKRGDAGVTCNVYFYNRDSGVITGISTTEQESASECFDACRYEGGHGCVMCIGDPESCDQDIICGGLLCQ